MTRLLFLCLALLAMPARADVTVTLDLAYMGAADLSPQARLKVTDLLTNQPIEVAEAEGEPGHRLLRFVVPDAAFPGPYARLRLAIDGLRLPQGDNKADQPIVFAVEALLRRDLITGDITLPVPVVTSSRKNAIKPALKMPQIEEELPERFWLSQQWSSLYVASPESVAAAPDSFGLQRLISRAMADFALALSQSRPGPVLLLPSEEMGETIKLYWPNRSEGRATHLRAWQEARTSLWLDLPQVQGLLSQARRSGVEGPKFCNQAKSLLAFFNTYRPSEAEAPLVDLVFPNPGTLQGYLDGRALDVKYSCTRYSF